jgi:polyisoprenoid-binding protein YceI
VTAPPPADRRSTRPIGTLVLAAVAVVVFGAVSWWYLGAEAPEEVSLDAATGQLDDGGVTVAAPAGFAGTWSVDTSTGEFSFGESTGTFVGFRVREELAGIGAATAVGRTPVVEGTLTIEGTTVTDVVIEADLSALTTDDRRRDSRVQSALGTAEHPIATFELTQPIALGDAVEAGGPVSVLATGELTVRGVSRPVTVALDAQVVGDAVVVVGSTEIVFADFGVTVPSAPIVLSAEDRGQLELQLFFTR